MAERKHCRNCMEVVTPLPAGTCPVCYETTGWVESRQPVGTPSTRYQGREVSVVEVLFGFSGRISRSEYWLKGVLPLLPISILNNFLAYGVDSGGARTLSMIIGVAALWPGFALLTKRWHDRNRSAWWFLAMLIPFLGLVVVLWIVIEVWFVKGTEGPNRFGGDPLRRGRRT